MKRKKLTRGVVLAIACCAVFIFTLATNTSAAEKVLSCTTYSVGSTGYATSMGLFEAVAQTTDIKVRVVPAGTDTSKILPLREKMMDLSLFTGAGQYFAIEGKGDFADWGPQPLRLIFGCPEGAVAGMMVRGNSGIKTLADLKGKRVTRIPGSPACEGLHAGYMAFGGLTWDDVKVVQMSSWGTAWKSVIEGSSDTAHCLVNSSVAFELASSPHGIHWLPAPAEDKEGWERMHKHSPYLYPYKVTTGAGATQENPAIIATYYYGLVSYPYFDEETAYKLTKAIWNGYDIYSPKHPSLKLWTQDGALMTDRFLSPYHPGSVKYFKEIGVWTKKHEERQQALLDAEKAKIKK
jgi:hypothetical protein